MGKPPTAFRISPAIDTVSAEELRARHPRFTYERFSLNRFADALRVQFHFRTEPNLEFAPETAFTGVDWERVDSLPPGMLENLLFHLGLIETLSYWKATCSPEIRVEAAPLDAEQIAWYLDLLRHGMGEFFYVNQIDWRSPEFVRVVPFRAATVSERERPGTHPLAHARGSETDRDLVLTSGGKDSVVTLELLRQAGNAFDCLLLNPTEAALAVARQALGHPDEEGPTGSGRLIVVRRTIDPRLLELNAAGYLNGHTPFSALLAVLGVTAAAIYGHRRVIVSNERSAEEPGVQYLGESINHQYSKTLRFETLFRDYCRQYLIPPGGSQPERPRASPGGLEGSAFGAGADHKREGIGYFSLLRPLYELQIACMFAAYPAYFPLFKSCNRGIKENLWCGRCPKCLFVYTVLYPFMERAQALSIFGQDLFCEEGAEAVLRALLGLDAEKPFECVGTRDETLAALYLCVRKYREQGIELPATLRAIDRDILSRRTDLPELADGILTAWTDEHHLPPEMAAALRRHALSDGTDMAAGERSHARSKEQQKHNRS